MRLTFQEAELIAERIVAAIEPIATDSAIDSGLQLAAVADRQRVASDLEGLRLHAQCGTGVGYCDDAGHAGETPPWDCSDGYRYLGGLLRTAALYVG